MMPLLVYVCVGSWTQRLFPNTIQCNLLHALSRAERDEMDAMDQPTERQSIIFSARAVSPLHRRGQYQQILFHTRRASDNSSSHHTSRRWKCIYTLYKEWISMSMTHIHSASFSTMCLECIKVAKSEQEYVYLYEVIILSDEVFEAFEFALDVFISIQVQTI